MFTVVEVNKVEGYEICEGHYEVKGDAVSYAHFLMFDSFGGLKVVETREVEKCEVKDCKYGSWVEKKVPTIAELKEQGFNGYIANY